MTQVWLLEPRDPLIVRDGRPNEGRSQSRTLPFPYPSTLAGAVRTRLGSDAQGRFDFPKNKLEDLRGVTVRGPLLADTDGGLYAPAPADALWAMAGDKPVLLPLVPKEKPSGALFDAGLAPGRLLVQPEPSPEPSKPPRGPLFWGWTEFEAWLSKPSAQRRAIGERVLDRGVKALARDRRVHVALDEAGTARDGMLFATEGLSFQRPLCGGAAPLGLVVEVESSVPGRALRPGLAPMGGERRLVRWGEARPGQRLPPDAPKAVLEHVRAHRRVRVVLLTPGLFAAGSEPAEGLLHHGATLVSSVVGRPETLSGWDFALKQPKPTRRLAPAGSVFWLDLSENPAERETWLREVWMRAVSDDAQDRRDGFGLAAVGVA